MYTNGYGDICGDRWVPSYCCIKMYKLYLKTMFNVLMHTPKSSIRVFHVYLFENVIKGHACVCVWMFGWICENARIRVYFYCIKCMAFSLCAFSFIMKNECIDVFVVVVVWCMWIYSIAEKIKKCHRITNTSYSNKPNNSKTKQTK